MEALDVKLDDDDKDDEDEDMCFTESDGNDQPLPHGVESRTLLTGTMLHYRVTVRLLKLIQKNYTMTPLFDP